MDNQQSSGSDTVAVKDESVRRETTVKLKSLEVRGTELSYVTSTDKLTRTFFAQFCKFSNEELVELNSAIETHCKSIMEERKNTSNEGRGKPKRVRPGDVYCAKYTLDGFWYRAKVLRRDKERGVCQVLFVDYGNIEFVDTQELVLVDPSEMPIFERPPFGISCYIDGCDKFSPERLDIVLSALTGSYIMIKFKAKQTDLQWKVDIPKHGYNTTFWSLYESKKVADSANDDATKSDIEKEKIKSDSGKNEEAPRGS